MTLKQKLFGSWKRKMLTGALALATVLGTYSGRDSGFAPFYVSKSGTSAGICVGGLVEFKPGSKFYGLVISGAMQNAGEVNGLYLGAVEDNIEKGVFNGASFGVVQSTKINSELNGLEASLVANITLDDIGGEVNGIQASLIGNWAGKVNGVQASIFYNGSRNLNGIQFGIYDEIIGAQSGFPFNYNFGGNQNETKN